MLDAVSGYIRTKSYSISDMEEREKKIRVEAEEVACNALSWPKRILFNWLLFHARRGKKAYLLVTPSIINIKIVFNF